MWWHDSIQSGSTPRTDFEYWKARNMTSPSRIPWGQLTSGRWLTRLSWDLAYAAGAVVHGSMQPKVEVANDWMVNAGRMLSGGHWCTSWRSGPKRAGRKGGGTITPPGQPWRTQRPLAILDNRDSFDNWDPVDIRDTLDNRNPWHLTLPYTLLQSIHCHGQSYSCGSSYCCSWSYFRSWSHSCSQSYSCGQSYSRSSPCHYCKISGLPSASLHCSGSPSSHGRHSGSINWWRAA